MILWNVKTQLTLRVSYTSIFLPVFLSAVVICFNMWATQITPESTKCRVKDTKIPGRIHTLKRDYSQKGPVKQQQGKHAQQNTYAFTHLCPKVMTDIFKFTSCLQLNPTHTGGFACGHLPGVQAPSSEKTEQLGNHISPLWECRK